MGGRGEGKEKEKRGDGTLGKGKAIKREEGEGREIVRFTMYRRILSLGIYGDLQSYTFLESL